MKTVWQKSAMSETKYSFAIVYYNYLCAIKFKCHSLQSTFKNFTSPFSKL